MKTDAPTAQPRIGVLLLISASVMPSQALKEAAAVLWGAAALFLAAVVTALVRQSKGTDEATGSGA